MKNAFSLVELMIVVALLGILAAAAVPSLSGHATKAKSSAARENLFKLRQAIEVYAVQHNDVAPGYRRDNAASTPNENYFRSQLTRNSAYLNEIPKNPFNNSDRIKILVSGEIALQSTDYGWVYMPGTKEVRLNTTGTDGDGVTYFEY
jgi:prepilin-type N-terminal cleavage/methylation domain-containing protein